MEIGFQNTPDLDSLGAGNDLALDPDLQRRLELFRDLPTRPRRQAATRDTSALQEAIREGGEAQLSGIEEAQRRAAERLDRAELQTLVNLFGANVGKIISGAPVDTRLEDHLATLREAEQEAARLEQQAAMEAPAIRSEAEQRALQLAAEDQFRNRQAELDAQFQNQQQAYREGVDELDLATSLQDVQARRDAAAARTAMQQQGAEDQAVAEAIEDPRLIDYYQQRFGWDDAFATRLREEAAKPGPDEEDVEAQLLGLTPDTINRQIQRLNDYIENGKFVPREFGQPQRVQLSPDEMRRAQERILELRQMRQRLLNRGMRETPPEAYENFERQVNDLRFGVPGGAQGGAPGAGQGGAQPSEIRTNLEQNIPEEVTQAAQESYQEVDRVTDEDLARAWSLVQNGRLSAAQYQALLEVRRLQDENR